MDNDDDFEKGMKITKNYMKKYFYIIKLFKFVLTYVRIMM